MNKRPLSPLLQICDSVLWLYQVLLSPDHSWLKVFWPAGVCRWQPTCSQYMREALAVYGWRGLWLGIQRIGRCHPGVAGGFDPLR